ncbi:ferredoxin--nitrite reductase [Flexivirga endophytica]|uniref:assimilatory sulfite reductase (ferredoxin) n=1 Tax=Flexivirga endophytica TaxID=1849103 RepID=A0A916TCW9_9MICO|nr:ferredoxin--nitrite reductase [Flexivirga endophytica]GHB48089.1 ferredoxin--nitrite reductase [Flexivirga endophytica]
MVTKTNGQWALGEHEPLNHNEQFKRDDDGLSVRARIEETYFKEGFASIPADDLRGRMRWWGLYTQRREGIPGGQTATLSPEELEAPYFMMRVRIDGGVLSTEQLRVIAGISQDFGRDTADLTDRQNVQFHWIEIENVPEIWRRLEAVGLETTEACGDCTRVVMGSPVAGLSVDEVLDVSPAVAEINRQYVGDPDLSNLPRKFKTSIAWLPDAAPEINDVSFVGVQHPELGPGFDLLVGGGLSTNPFLAERLGVFVTLEQLPDVWVAVVRLFRDYGYRRSRNRARMKFLVADWGVAKYREVLENEYLKAPLPDGPAATLPTTKMDHVGVHDQRGGGKYVGFTAVAGRLSGTSLAAVADAAEAAGSQRVRLTPYQKLIVADVPDEAVDGLIETLKPLGLNANPTPWRRNLMACTGVEYCKLAIVDTKERAHALLPDLEKRLADIDPENPISVHLNGCANSCARVQVADIGLKGQIVTDADGNRVEGFQVHLGGRLGQQADFGRKLRGHKVTSAELGDYIERVARNYLAGRTDHETFSDWAIRADEEVLR